MTYVYGALKPTDPTDPFANVPLIVEIDKSASQRPTDGFGRWPYYKALFRFTGSDEILATAWIPALQSMVVDESNVFDLLEYIVYNFGKRQGSPGSPYDIRLAPEVDGCDPVVMKRAVGCRHFVFYRSGSNSLHVTVHGHPIIGGKNRNDTADILFVKAEVAPTTPSWNAGTDTEGFSLNFFTEGHRKAPITYQIPFSFSPTPREMSKMAIAGTKATNSNPDNFTSARGLYDPTRLIKNVETNGFWYLKSFDGKVILTLIKDPAQKAMAAVFALIAKLPSDDRQNKAAIYCEWLAKATLNFEGKEVDKRVILDAIEMIEKLKLHSTFAEE